MKRTSTRRPRSRLASACAAMAVLAVGGCSSLCSEAPRAPAPETAAPVVEPQPDVAAYAPERPAGEPAPRRDAFRVDDNGRVTVRGDAVPRGAVLRRLSEAFGFSVRLEGQPPLRETVALRIEDQALEAALGEILRGTPYSLHYDGERETGEPRLAVLTVGAIDFRKLARNRGPKEGAEARAEIQRARQRRDERAASRERDERQRVDEVERMLASSDPRDRVAAVERMKTEREGEIDVLEDLLASDPSPLVRSAAAEKLEGAEAADALGTLLAALDDADPTVVVTAIEAIEFVGDENVIPQLSEYASHPDPDVRKAIIEAIDYLEE